MKWKSWGLRLLIVIALLAIVNEFRPKQVFRDLTQDGVVSADVLFGAYPPYPMTTEDQRKLVLYLQSVVVTRRAPEYTAGYAGGTAPTTFRLNMADGSAITISYRHPFFIINGTGYRCHYAPDGITALFGSYIDTIRSATEPITNK